MVLFFWKVRPTGRPGGGLREEPLPLQSMIAVLAGNRSLELHVDRVPNSIRTDLQVIFSPSLARSFRTPRGGATKRATMRLSTGSPGVGKIAPDLGPPILSPNAAMAAGAS